MTVKFSRTGNIWFKMGFLLYIFPLGKIDARTLGSIVPGERKVRGLRQEQLAAAAGVGGRFIVDLEAGKPTMQLAKALPVLSTLGWCRARFHLDTLDPQFQAEAVAKADFESRWIDAIGKH